MARYDAATAEILVFTFKEGLLSAVAHDLKLKATKFSLEVEGDTAKLELDAGSLRVVNAMKDGVDAPSMVPSSKFPEIEENARETIGAKKFATIRFESTAVSETAIAGKLTLNGQTREVRGSRSGNSAELRFDQRDFGIKPFSAMLGALKVKPEVRVTVRLE